MFILFCYFRAFDRYDVNHDGFITVDDLRIAFRSQGRECTDEDVQNWVSKRSRHHSGRVSFIEFKEHYTKPVKM
jgi:Ca2+-binding EF-hand superfamily protein